jgi:hypothetical protein
MWCPLSRFERVNLGHHLGIPDPDDGPP